MASRNPKTKPKTDAEPKIAAPPEPEVQAPKQRGEVWMFASLKPDVLSIQIVVDALDENGKKLGKFPLQKHFFEVEDAIEHLRSLDVIYADPEIKEEIRAGLIEQRQNGAQPA